jgi:uncharacterized protein (DUF111 family)
VKRAGLRATRVRLFVHDVELGAPAPLLDELQRHARPDRFERAHHRRATPRPRRHEPSRAPPAAAASATAVEGGGPVFGRDAGVDEVRARREQQARDRKLEAKRSGTSAQLSAWLFGEPARGAELLEVLKGSELSPVAKALALKAARRIVEALAAIAGPGARLEGLRAARILCDLVVAAALLEELSPAAVSASPVAVSAGVVESEGVVDAAAWPAPSPWLLEVLAGVPIIERDEAAPLSDIAGAAFAWSVAQRFGARGVSSTTRQGLGVDAVELPGRFVGVRALVGPPLAVPTRAGERQLQPLFMVRAQLGREVDLQALAAELAALGGRSPALVDEVPLEAGSHDGTPRGGIQLLAPPGAVDALTGLLWRSGAVDVVTSWVELRSAGVTNVTVPVGRGRTKMGVRVRVVKDGEEVVHVEPDPADVRAAAGKQRASPHKVAAEAVAAWERWTGKGGDDDAG